MSTDASRLGRRWQRLMRSGRDALAAMGSIAALRRLDRVSASSGVRVREDADSTSVDTIDSETRPLRGLRNQHRLVPQDDGSPRCTACQLCTVVCPSDCLEVQAESLTPGLDRSRPQRFTIDALSCVMCGLCVEACPIDALRMDGDRPLEAQQSRADGLFDLTRGLRYPESRELDS